MTSKERVLKSVRREKVDRVPLFYRDVPEVEHRLLRDLNLSSRDELLKYLGIDFRWISPEYIGPDLGDPESGTIGSIFGIKYVRRNVGQGGYWEPEFFPLEKTEDPATLDDYPWPEVEWFDFSVVQDLFGMEKTLVDMYINPDFWLKASEKIMEFNLSFIERLYQVAGDRIDFYRIGEDYGTQRGLLFGPEQWTKFIKPTLIDMISIPKLNNSYYYQHTCGGIRDLIPLLIETGVDVLDPIQVLADGMAPEDLKKDFGNQLTFSGGIDEQELLPNGKPKQVRENVIKILETLGAGGGYFLGPTHNFQEDIPTENIIAMYQAAADWCPL